MRPLPERNWRKAIRALDGVGINHLFALAVLEGQVEGEVYADDPLDPAAFYVLHSYGMTLLYGEPQDERFFGEVRARLLNGDGSRKRAEWLQVWPDAWNARLHGMLGRQLRASDESAPAPDAAVEVHTRVNFRFDPLRFESSMEALPECPLPLVRVDAQIYEAVRGAVVPHFFWRSRDAFLRDGIGFSAIDGRLPASTAFSAFIHGTQLEIGIETHGAFQGRGLAQHSCGALIAHCIAAGLEPLWACREGNTASLHLAQRLGFVPTHRIPYYRLP